MRHECKLQHFQAAGPLVVLTIKAWDQYQNDGQAACTWLSWPTVTWNSSALLLKRKSYCCISKRYSSTVGGFLYETLNYALPKNRHQYVRKLFTTSGLLLDLKKLTNNTFYPKKNGHVEQYSPAFVVKLRQYVSDNQKYWDQYVKILTSDYDT